MSEGRPSSDMGRSSLGAAVPCQGWCGPSQTQPPYGTPHLGLSGGGGAINGKEWEGDDMKEEEGDDMKEEEGEDMNEEEGDDVKE